MRPGRGVRALSRAAFVPKPGGLRAGFGGRYERGQFPGQKELSVSRADEGDGVTLEAASEKHPHIGVVETIAGGTGRRLELFVECAVVRGLIAAPGEPAH